MTTTDVLAEVNRWTLDEQQARADYAEAQIERQAIEHQLFEANATWEPTLIEATTIDTIKTAGEREAFVKTAKDAASLDLRAKLRDAKAWELRSEARHAAARHRLQAAVLAVNYAIAMRQPI